MSTLHHFVRSMTTICILMILSLMISAGWVHAQQPAPSQPGVQPCAYGIKAGVPFIWLRTSASSTAPFVLTLYPGQTVQPSGTAMQWDGLQWWIYVWPNYPNVHGYYWVEFGSLTPLCQPTVPPTPTAISTGNQPAPWYSGMLVLVRRSVPFVWFRAIPMPGTPPTHTVLAGAALLITLQDAALDNYGQWWWAVRDPATNRVGWVEEWALEKGSMVILTPTPVPNGAWQAGNTVRLRPNIPFSWLRTIPSSQAPWVYTAVPRQELIIQGDSQSDGVQRWWNVSVPGLGQSISGWVEEGSLEFVRQ